MVVYRELLALREQLLEELYIREKEVELIEAGKGVEEVAIDPQEFVVFKSRHPLDRYLNFWCLRYCRDMTSNLLSSGPR